MNARICDEADPSVALAQYCLLPGKSKDRTVLVSGCTCALEREICSSGLISPSLQLETSS